MDANNKEDSTDSTMGSSGEKPIRRRAGKTGMSYKFQRLREKLRAAIASGELAGKLPGERALARRFHANAKTLSKALTDLAAEGVLDRSIGRGTYVKGSAPASSAVGRWLVLAEAADTESALISAFRTVNPELQIATSVVEMRPSFLNQFSAVIDMAANTPESFLRNLVVRNMSVVVVNREPKTYSMHSVVMDAALGAARLGRDLVLAGHRRIAAIESPGSCSLSVAIRNAVAPIAADVVVDTCTCDEFQPAPAAGPSAIICESCSTAHRIRATLEQKGLHIPDQVSLAAVGCINDAAPCSGYYCTVSQLAEAVTGLLRVGGGSRPSTLWLAGAWHNLGTTHPNSVAPIEESTSLPIGAMLQ